MAKYHSMRHSLYIIFDYSLHVHNQILENVQSAKYFDITIADNMDWDQHISGISSKGTELLHLGVVRKSHNKLCFCLN